MPPVDQAQRERNYEIIMGFMKQCACDDLNGSVQATIAQFLINTRHELNKRARSNGSALWVTPLDILESQILELRRCVIDLESYRNRLLEGVSVQ